MEYQFTIGIKSGSKERAKEVANALIIIKNSLSEQDTIDLAKILQEKPGVVQTAKKLFG